MSRRSNASMRPIPPPELVVEREHFDDQPGAQPKRRGRALILRSRAAASKDDFALDVAQERRGIAARACKRSYSSSRRNEIRNADRSTRLQAIASQSSRATRRRHSVWER